MLETPASLSFHGGNIPGGGGGDTHMEQTEMLVGNFEFNPQRRPIWLFTPLSETTSIPVCFIRESPSPPRRNMALLNSFQTKFSGSTLYLDSQL